MAETQGFIAEQRETNARFDQFIVEQREHNRNTDTRLNRMDGRMDNGFGAQPTKPRRPTTWAASPGRDLRLRRIRVLKALGFPTNEGLGELVADAEDQGALTEEEVNDLLATDLIAVGRSRDNGHDVYVAAEVSVTVGTRTSSGRLCEPGIWGKSRAGYGAGGGRRKTSSRSRKRWPGGGQVTVMLLPAS